MSLRCSIGHESDEPDYCSVCGIAMDADAAAAPPRAAAAGAAPAAGACPTCGEPRTDPGARYCEVCRFDFTLGVAGPPPGGDPPASPGAPAVVAAGTTSTTAANPLDTIAAPVATGARAASQAPGGLWDAYVSVDPTLDDEPDPADPCPDDEPERVFPLDLAETLIGRRDDRRDIRPDIPLRDSGVSRRHLKLLRQPDGGLAVVDLASTNGTCLNGCAVTAGVRQPLHDGDAITVGRWTRIVVRGRQ
jgi:hypothetical protein